jgi:hypothetical protein
LLFNKEGDLRNVSPLLALLAAVAVFPVAANADPTPASTTPEAYYLAALAQMRDISEPAYISYRTNVPPGKSTLAVKRGPDGRASLFIELTGNAPANSWEVAYRTSDRLASIPISDGTHVLSSLALFDPTWNGVDAWMHRGLSASATTPEPSTAPSASPAAAQSLPVIAVVNAMSPGSYTIEDAGAGDCDGRPGHMLRLKAKRNPQSHPLTGVTVDLATQRFCSMRFALHEGNLVSSVTGSIELRFGDVGNYYLVTGGDIDVNVRSIGISAARIDTSFAYADMAFPDHLPDSAFTFEPAPARSAAPR